MAGRDEFTFDVEIPVPDGMTEDQAVDQYMDRVEAELLKRLDL